MIVGLASDRLAEDIVMLDLRQVASFADYFVIMSAESSRQIEYVSNPIARLASSPGDEERHGRLAGVLGKPRPQLAHSCRRQGHGSPQALGRDDVGLIRSHTDPAYCGTG